MVEEINSEVESDEDIDQVLSDSIEEIANRFAYIENEIEEHT